MNLKRWRLSLKGLNHKDLEAQAPALLANKDLILTKVLLPINLIQTSRDLAAPVLLRIPVLAEDPVPLRILDLMDPPAKDQDLQEVLLQVALHQAAIHWQPEVPLQASKLPATTTCSETAEYKTSPNREICNRRAQQSTQ